MCCLSCRTRARFDPREQEKGLQTRNGEAQEAAKKFAERLLSGGLNPAAKDFNQGEGASETKYASLLGKTKDLQYFVSCCQNSVG